MIIIISSSSSSSSSSWSCIIIIVIIIIIIIFIINLDIIRASLFSVITLHCSKELQVSMGEGVPIILLYYFFLIGLCIAIFNDRFRV